MNFFGFGHCLGVVDVLHQFVFFLFDKSLFLLDVLIQNRLFLGVLDFVYLQICDLQTGFHDDKFKFISSLFVSVYFMLVVVNSAKKFFCSFFLLLQIINHFLFQQVTQQFELLFSLFLFPVNLFLVELPTFQHLLVFTNEHLHVVFLFLNKGVINFLIFYSVLVSICFYSSSLRFDSRLQSLGFCIYFEHFFLILIN